MKRFSSSVVSLVVSATFMLLGAGTAAQAQEKPVTLKAGLGSSLTGSSHGLGLAKFKELIEKETFDLILLDIMLPGVDGFDIMEYIRPLNGWLINRMTTAARIIVNKMPAFVSFVFMSYG